jgi:hypothetical protein
MKALITLTVLTITAATLIAACNADKIAHVVVKAKSEHKLMRDAGCIDQDKNYTATDYCMSVLYPSVGDFMGGAE